MPYITSGLKQDHKQRLFMECYNTNTHETTRLSFDTVIQPSMQNVQLDTNSRHAHVWSFDETKQEYTASVCGIFGCACCDTANRNERIQNVKH